jgi:NDP-sugar pyrophosphorylase family protein
MNPGERKSVSADSLKGQSDRFPALWDLKHSEFFGLFESAEFPWDVLKLLDAYLQSKLESVSGPKIRSFIPHGVHIEGDMFIDEGCAIEEGVYIRGPAWIGKNCEVRSGCYIRGGVLAEEGAVLGHSSEFKHCVLLGLAQAPHFNYVGDSVMGRHAHIGAGVILSNFRLDGKVVPARALGSKERIDSGLPKFGALIGDGCEIGCNTVLNPGTILGERSVVMPLSLVSGTWPRESRIENQAMRRPG